MPEPSEDEAEASTPDDIDAVTQDEITTANID